MFVGLKLKVNLMGQSATKFPCQKFCAKGTETVVTQEPIQDFRGYLNTQKTKTEKIQHSGFPFLQ